MKIDNVALPFFYQDLTHLNEQGKFELILELNHIFIKFLKIERDSAAMRIVQEAALAPFSLVNDAFLRCFVIKIAAKEHYLLLSMHHMATDGWSMGLILR